MNGTAFTMVFVFGFFIVFAGVFLAIGYVWAWRDYRKSEEARRSVRVSAERAKRGERFGKG